MAPDPSARPDRAALLALVVAGRDDPARAAGARAAWRELVAGEHERVRALVAVFRFPDRPDVRIPADQVDDVAQEAFARLLMMLDGFRGQAPAELQAAVATATRFTCMDWCRRQLVRDRHAGASLDDETRGTLEGRLVGRATGQHAARADARDDLAAVAEALQRLPSETQRTVVRLTALGYDSREIAEQLGLTRVNVNQLRSRALRRLREDCDD